METEAESATPLEAASSPQAPPRAALIYQWVEEHLPQSRQGRILVALAIGLVVLVPSIALLLLPIWFDLSEGRFATFGYAGVFVANLASTATVFIPVPGLTATGQTLINEQGAILNPVWVGLLGGTGMALGEVTAYAAGAVGSEVAREGQFEAPRLVRPVVERVIRWIDWLMDHYAVTTLVVLSVIPNPAFELAGITAGAVRMSFWRFMAAVLVGKIGRGLLLAFLGDAGIEFLFFT